VYSKVRETPAAGLPQTRNPLTESDLQRGGRRPCHRTDSAVQCFPSVPLLRYGACSRILDLGLVLARVFDSGIKSYIDHSFLQGTAVHSSTVIDDIVIVSRLNVGIWNELGRGNNAESAVSCVGIRSC